MPRPLLFALLFGGSVSVAQAQLISDSLLIEGRYRVFHYNKPAWPTQKASLIFVLHGSGGNGRGMMGAAANMEKQARTDQALVVYPDAFKNFWNECRKASPSVANQENINEQAFFARMIGYFKTRYGINDQQVFAVGTSGGGHMAYKLALTMPRRFRAITALIANLPDTSNMDCALSGEPVAVMIVNGTADPINPYDGGLVLLGKNRDMNMGTVQSTDQTLAYWAGLARYHG